MEPEKPSFEISVTSEDPKKKDDKESKENEESKDTSGTEKKKAINGEGKSGKNEPAVDELSEEDQSLKNELEMLVERLKESDITLYIPALESLRNLIRTSTSSMTSVPKPLKFLRPFYSELEAVRSAWGAELSTQKTLLASILSVLAMTYSDTGKRDTLHYRLISQSTEDPGSWGNEYVRHLAAELGEEYLEISLPADEGEEKPKLDGKDSIVEDAKEQDKKIPSSPRAETTKEGLLKLALDLVPFFLKHNAEADAVDLLLELEAIERILEVVDKDTYQRVCLYMVSCVNLLVPPDDIRFLRTAHAIYAKHSRYSEAMTLAIRIGDKDLVREAFNAPANLSMKKQLAFHLARSNIPIDWVTPEIAEGSDDMPELEEELVECISNTKLSEFFKLFAKELDVVEPKGLEDIYKSHLESTRTMMSIDSARANLAGTFVNAFVNAGFGNDKLMVEAEEGNSWIYKNKDHGMMSAAASLGMSLLWDTDVGLSHVDKYMYSSEEYIKAGAVLATGILHAGVRTEVDAAFALLEPHVESKSVPLKISAIIGIGLAYSGAQRQDLLDLLSPYIADETTSMEVASLTALALGFIFVGSANGEVAELILTTMTERTDDALGEKWARFMALGLALLYVGRQDASDATCEILKTIPHLLAKQASILTDVCAYAGTGNVLKVQSMLHHCNDHLDKEKDDPTYQGLAVLGIAIIAMGEDVGAEMSLRQFNHLMYYGDPVIRKAVPLALGLLSASNPQLAILDTLSKYSHDNDLEVALNAIFALGLVGAGTNNAKLAQMLRQLAGYYQKEQDCLFVVRVAQGLVHMGKGTIGINPFHSDRSLMSKTAIAGLLATVMAFTEAKKFVLDKSHWMMYFLVSAMYPRFFITLDEKLEPKQVTTRVGLAVDVVGQAGKPRGISGFVTHQTPVRIGTLERAELATEEFFAYSHVLEGLVILHPNEGYEKMDI
ncbi:26s proteasome regulatory complex non-atpase subcomplex rpn1 subunit [Phaffia rhodozyma]|uniref:26S proteasome regulatory subunit RPN1 n=1 Tax=Phaffia rhodozyma TaxID=264483 RepID=A0A0F7SQA7_PHARH|nr:26s proteasome regulatory complex non-atpase subcomplex rpn1 subunit [Phaffia rhodozyma]